jgi:hypothetical protein
VRNEGRGTRGILLIGSMNRRRTGNYELCLPAVAGMTNYELTNDACPRRLREQELLLTIDDSRLTPACRGGKDPGTLILAQGSQEDDYEGRGVGQALADKLLGRDEVVFNRVRRNIQTISDSLVVKTPVAG